MLRRTLLLKFVTGVLTVTALSSTGMAAAGSGQSGGPMFLLGVVLVIIGVMSNMMFFGYAFMTGNLSFPFLSNDTNTSGRRDRRSRRGNRGERDEITIEDLNERARRIRTEIQRNGPGTNRQEIRKYLRRAERNTDQDNLVAAAKALEAIERLVKHRNRR